MELEELQTTGFIHIQFSSINKSESSKRELKYGVP